MERAMRDGKKRPELLIPAGSLEVLKTAVTFGADAVYIGGEAFGLRAKAKNFSAEDMAEGIPLCKACFDGKYPMDTAGGEEGGFCSPVSKKEK